MPKDRRVNFLSSHRATVSPYACSSKDSNGDKLESSLQSVGDEKEWEEARCPICMEHPHNAVFLLCSSHENGCRPYMCDTSYRHSNCLDQFRKSSAMASPADVQELLCPLCRGQISGWLVIETARRYMNSKVRSCSGESCNFSGNYTELRKHARREHPAVRPSEVDSELVSRWLRMQQESNLQDTLSAVLQPDFGHHLDEDEFFDYDIGDDNTFAELQLDSDFHDAFNRIPLEAENELDGDGGLLVDLDFADFAFTFLSELSSGRSEGWGSIGSVTTGGRSLTRRSMTSRSRSRSNYQRETASPRRQDTSRSAISSSRRSNYQGVATSPRRRNTIR